MSATAARHGHTYAIALGFGTAGAMWAAGYFLRIPPALAPGWLVLALLLVLLAAGGWCAGRYSGYGAVGGALTGLMASLVNLLILGSLMGGERGSAMGAAMVWGPATLAIGLVVGALGALAGLAGRKPAVSVNWTAFHAMTAVCTTFLLIIAGGLVTSHEAGLAVVDWPNTEGQLMFLYPLAKMTGGIFFEHSHRLIGTLVGLTTLCLALMLQFGRHPARLKLLGWAALVLVTVQGILGGLRVTGVFTLSTDPAQTAPNIILAIVHGVVGQLFLAVLVAIAVFVSSSWRSAPAAIATASASVERGLGRATLVLLIVQLVLGAILRHMAGGLHLHITLAVIVLMAALAMGVRLWGLYYKLAVLHKSGWALIIIAGAQLTLGLAALIATGAAQDVHPEPMYSVVIATAHQTTGALLLAVTTYAVLWTQRLVHPPG